MKVKLKKILQIIKTSKTVCFVWFSHSSFHRLQAHQKYIAVALKNVPNAGQTLQRTIHTLSAASHKKVLSPLKPPKMPSGISNTIMSAVSPGTTSLLSTQKNTYILPNSNNSSNNSNNINKPTNHYIGGGGSFTDLISEVGSPCFFLYPKFMLYLGSCATAWPTFREMKQANCGIVSSDNILLYCIYIYITKLHSD